MTVNRKNFEAYLLDYLEGNLDPLLTADLMAFLAENPEFETYIPDYDGRTLTIDAVQFGNKNTLKRDFSDVPGINAENFDEFCIARCEGLLDPEECERLDNYIARNPERQKNLALFRSLRLEPDTTIVYTGKQNLKKPFARGFGRFIYTGLGIAASLALIIFISLNRQPGKIVKISSRAMTNIESSEISKVESTQEITRLQELNKDKVTMAPVPSVSQKMTPLQEKETDQVQFESEPERDPVPPAMEPLETSDLPVETAKIMDMPSPPEENELADLTDIPVSDSEDQSFLKSLVSKIDFWKTAETALNSINYLTESQLSISKTTDENGNLTGLLLNTESYSIEGNKSR